MEKSEKKNTHGGRREGAGRPKKDIGRYFGFNATKEVTAILDSLEGSRTDYINAAIVAWFNSHR